LPSGVPPQRL